MKYKTLTILVLTISLLSCDSIKRGALKDIGAEDIENESEIIQDVVEDELMDIAEDTFDTKDVLKDIKYETEKETIQDVIVDDSVDITDDELMDIQIDELTDEYIAPIDILPDHTFDTKDVLKDIDFETEKETIQDIKVDEIMDIEGNDSMDFSVDESMDVCVPNCTEKECGDNGCGGSCGECSEGIGCFENKCQCTLNDHKGCYGDAVYWYDSCENIGNKLTDCPYGCENAQCKACVPDCEGKNCGYDGCQSDCGSCTCGNECISGTCEFIACEGKECGDDGCNGNCGECLSQETCKYGTCVSADTKCWDKNYGGSAYSIQLTTDGGYVVAGGKGSDLWVIKIDKDGGMEWDKTYGGEGQDYARSIQQTTDGGYIVAGTALIKINKDGNIIWEKIYGLYDGAYSIQQTKDNGYVFAGYIKSKGEGESDFWVTKLDEYGNIIWDKTYGGSDTDVASSIQQTTDGGYIVAGGWILRLDQDGGFENCE